MNPNLVAMLVILAITMTAIISMLLMVLAVDDRRIRRQAYRTVHLHKRVTR